MHKQHLTLGCLVSKARSHVIYRLSYTPTWVEIAIEPRLFSGDFILATYYRCRTKFCADVRKDKIEIPN